MTGNGVSDRVLLGNLPVGALSKSADIIVKLHTGEIRNHRPDNQPCAQTTIIWDRIPMVGNGGGKTRLGILLTRREGLLITHEGRREC